MSKNHETMSQEKSGDIQKQIEEIEPLTGEAVAIVGGWKPRTLETKQDRC